jgi:neutral ceramidase
MSRSSRSGIRALTLALLGAAVLIAGPPALPSSADETPFKGYLVGTGIADITGEAAEVGMMGYAALDQKTSGIHQRQRARAFVFVDRASGKRVAIVNTDLQGMMQSVQQAVIGRLQARFNDRYSDRNVLISATHTHAGPGGFSHYALYNITVLGFQEKTFNAIVDGIVDAVVQADGDAKPGTLALGRSMLTDASANRSRDAFDRNPAADKAAFPLGIDTSMTALRVRQDSADVGAISWFATHGTSMTNKNTLISGDNKGYAEYAWEHDRAGVRYREPDSKEFVAAFAQTNAGDMTPNLNLKAGSGPTENEFDNTRIIGSRQLDAATAAFGSASEISGGIDYRMRYVNMSKVAVDGRFTTDGAPHVTCPAALGTAFAAGSMEDGIALGFIKEGNPTNPLLKALGGAIFDVPQSLRVCQAPKEVIIANGTTKPYPWTPEVLPMQLIKVGPLYLAAVPAEFTIVAGYRLRKTVAAELGVPAENVILSGYANAYSGYVTTPEEYDQQHYEGGGVHFGKWTLPAYQQEFTALAAAMREGRPAPADEEKPRDLTGKQLNFQTGVVFDDKPANKSFGSVNTDAKPSYRRGETAVVEFWTGHPKNNLRRGGTFLEVQRQVNDQWITVADDGDWSTIYRWSRSGFANSLATISWAIPADTPAGTYRIVHHGDSKDGWTGQIRPFTGTSRSFTVG